MASLAEQVAILKRELVLDASLSIPDSIQAAAHALGYSPAPDEPLATRACNLLKQLGKDSSLSEHAAASKLQAAQRAKSGKMYDAGVKAPSVDPDRIAEIKAKTAEAKSLISEMRAEREAKQLAREAEKEAKAAANAEESEETVAPADPSVPTTKISVRVTVPAGIGGGQKAKASLANGLPVVFTVPAGTKAGTTLLIGFSVPTNQVPLIDAAHMEKVGGFAAAHDHACVQLAAVDQAAALLVASAQRTRECKQALHQLSVRARQARERCGMRSERIEACSSSSPANLTALNPQLWLRGGISGKIKRQAAKLDAEQAEVAHIDGEIAKLQASLSTAEADYAAYSTTLATRPSLENSRSQAYVELIGFGRWPTPVHLTQAEDAMKRARQQEIRVLISTIERAAFLCNAAAQSYERAVMHAQAAIDFNRAASGMNNRRMNDGFRADFIGIYFTMGRELFDISERDQMVGASEAETMKGNQEVDLLAREVPQPPLAVHQRHKAPGLTMQFYNMDLAVQPPNTFTLDGQAVKDGYCSARRNARMSDETKMKSVLNTNIKELRRVNNRIDKMRQSLATLKNSLTASIDLSVNLDAPGPAPWEQPAPNTPVGIPVAVALS